MEDRLLTTLNTLADSLDAKKSVEDLASAVDDILKYALQIKSDNDIERAMIRAHVEKALSDGIERAQNRLLRTSQTEWSVIKSKIDSFQYAIDNLKDGETPSEDKLRSLIVPLIPATPIVPTKEELMALMPSMPEVIMDTPNQVVDKINQSENLIKASKIDGLQDIERIAKANANFNPAMGPSFSDLRDIRQTVTDLSNTVTREGKFSLNFIIDGGGSAITTGVKGFVEIPYPLTITGWQIFADQVGSIVVDVWKDTYANFPPTVGDSIAGSELPTLASAQSNQDLSLSTWTTSASGGDILAFNVQSVATVTRVTISILGTKN